MATYYSQSGDNWSSLTVWNTVATGGGTNPASVAAMDNNTFVIQSGHTIVADVNMSGFATGIAGLTINGGVTPGTLVSKADASGVYYLMIKTATMISGTTSTNCGRILANSDGVWANSGDLPFDRKFIIDLKGTAYLNADNLDIKLYDTEPTYTSVSTYGSIKTVSSVNTSTNVITMTAPHGWASSTAVCIRSSGDLPAPLVADTVYYVISPSGADLKLALYSGGIALDITTTGSGTIEIYDGHTSTSTATMNVLTDVTGDTQWAAGAAVVLVDCNAPEAYDQQRTTISSLNSTTVTLGANVDSAQYPGAKIWLVQRNIAIKNNGTTAAQSIVTFGASTFTGCILKCEIRNTGGSGTTYYGHGVNAGYGHTISGAISGCSNGVNSGTNHTISGTVSGCSNGVNSGTNHTISGAVNGCSYGVIYGTNHTISGAVSGCGNGVYFGTNHTISGTVSGCYYGVVSGTNHTISGAVSGCNNGVREGTNHTISGTVSGCSSGIIYGANYTISGAVSGCSYGVNSGTNHTISGAVSGCSYNFRCDAVSLLWIKSKKYSTVLPTFYNRNTVALSPYNVVQYSSYGDIIDNGYSFYQFGDIIKETGVLRSGGATSSIKAVPLSNCTGNYQCLPLFEWNECNVPSSPQTRSIYILGSGWSTFPTTGELYWETEYFSGTSGLSTAKSYSTGVLVDNTTWTPFTINFTPGQTGVVTYKGFLQKYAAASCIFIDSALYTS